MRPRALVVLLLLVGLLTPAAPAAGAQTAASMWEQGHELMRRGDYAPAEQVYASLAETFPDSAPRALLLQARAALADGSTDAAEATLQQLLGEYPASDQTAPAYFTLEQVRRAAGDCAGAMRALDAFEGLTGATAVGPYIALQRAQCASQVGDWGGELSAAQSALSIEQGGPRLTQIEALERGAEAELKLGRKQDALNFYTRSLALAGTRAYRAEMLFDTAALARALGQHDLAAERFRAVVVDYADQARAPGALDALVDMSLGGTVSPLQAGRVRLNGGQYASAAEVLDQGDQASPDWGAAQLDRAEALLKLGNAAAANQVLQAVVDNDAAHAGSALLRIGQLQERDGDQAAAESTYLQMVSAAADRAAEALFHVGFVRYVRGNSSGAVEAWRLGLASGPPAPILQSQLLYWTARATPTGSDAWATALEQAVAASPESYYGLRAQEQLRAAPGLALAGRSTSLALQALSPSEFQERSAWLAGFNTSPELVSRDVSALPALQRADALLELGLTAEAGWEVDAVQQLYAQTHDVAHLSALADWLTARDLPQLALRVGKQERDMVGLEHLPRAIQKQVYPAAWGDLVAEQASQHELDPLLMLALMRQESSFDAHAQSGAQAMGLTQVVPSTGRSIAAHLGIDDFAPRDLFRPAISVEFGTWYLSQLLDQYAGRIFPALAAYDAGGGNVGRWLQRFGDDPDLLVEQIPFAETQTYLRVVYDNYWHYQALYASH